MRSTLVAYRHAMAAAIAVDPDTWWPARSRFEIAAGAILVQNTAWSNVAAALARLRGAGRLSVAGVRQASPGELEELLRSSGFWRQKAIRLRGFADWLEASYGGSLDRMFAQPTGRLREQLLALHGIGEETADAILLFAGDHPCFVMDAYTQRVLSRHGLPATRAWIEGQLARCRPRARAYRHVHALVVETAKRYCHKRNPDCGHCPLGCYLPAAAAAPAPDLAPTLARRRVNAGPR